MPAISIIVPVYQVEKYIRRCLDSLLGQTMQDFEIICVDDCGTDGSMRIVEELRTRFPKKIRVLHNERNTGLGASRDAGLQEAAGKYVTFVDSDDYVAPDYLDRFFRAAENGADLVAGGFVRAEGIKKKDIPVNETDPWYLWVNVSAWAKLYRTDFLRENGINFRGIRRYEDGFFAYRCLLADPAIIRLPYEGYYYVQNPASITQSKGGDRSGYFIDFADACLTFLDEIPDGGGKHREILQYCLMQAMSVNLLYNGRRCGSASMARLYQYYDRVMLDIDRATGGGSLHNRLISPRIPASEPEKNKLAACAVLTARRHGLDEAIYRTAALL